MGLRGMKITPGFCINHVCGSAIHQFLADQREIIGIQDVADKGPPFLPLFFHLLKALAPLAFALVLALGGELVQLLLFFFLFFVVQRLVIDLNQAGINLIVINTHVINFALL